MIARRTDTQGRDVTDTPGLWGDSDRISEAPGCLEEAIVYLYACSHVRIRLTQTDSSQEAWFSSYSDGYLIYRTTCGLHLVLPADSIVRFTPTGYVMTHNGDVTYLEDQRP